MLGNYTYVLVGIQINGVTRLGNLLKIVQNVRWRLSEEESHGGQQ